MLTEQNNVFEMIITLSASLSFIFILSGFGLFAKNVVGGLSWSQSLLTALSSFQSKKDSGEDDGSASRGNWWQGMVLKLFHCVYVDRVLRLWYLTFCRYIKSCRVSILLRAYLSGRSSIWYSLN